ncbi:MAG: chemotaxis protein CheX [Gemmatimonadota bacterium]
MPETLAAPLVEASIQTFEQLAYFFAESGPDDAAPDAIDPLQVDGVVSVAFCGLLCGGVVLQLAGGILPALAANMLGLDDGASAGEQQDALGEAANVICGNVLPRIAGTAAVFTLGVPQRFESWTAAVDALGPVAAHVRFDIEGGRADVALVMRPTP